MFALRFDILHHKHKKSNAQCLTLDFFVFCFYENDLFLMACLYREDSRILPHVTSVI